MRCDPSVLTTGKGADSPSRNLLDRLRHQDVSIINDPLREAAAMKYVRAHGLHGVERLRRLWVVECEKWIEGQ